MKRVLIAALSLGASTLLHAAQMSDPALIKQGEYLARAGDCVACHTAKGGKPFAGGLPMQTPIGTIYSTNITPDPTGIGDYSLEDFERAVRQGGAALIPVIGAAAAFDDARHVQHRQAFDRRGGRNEIALEMIGNAIGKAGHGMIPVSLPPG